MAGAHTKVDLESGKQPVADESTLISAFKTTSRLVPRQITDEIELAKLELAHKKARLGGIAISTGLLVVFLALLVIALVVAAIAGLATVMPLWLSSLIVSGALLLLVALCGLISFVKFKSLLPLLPENAWRGIRHDLGIAREGRNFDPATLIVKKLSKAEEKALGEQKKLDAAKAKAESDAKAAANGPQATQSELIERTTARREHLLNLREELVDQADVKKQTNYFLGQAKEKARESVSSVANSVVVQSVETVKTRWKPLSIFVVSATACVLLLRKLFKK